METVNQLETTLEPYFTEKAPFQIPKDIKELLVKIAPILVIIFVILAIPAVLALFGISALFSPIIVGVASPFWYISTILLAVAVVLEGLAIPGLLNRTMPGWRYVFYAQLVSLVSTLLQGNIVGAILSALIGFYILFQVKEMYT